MLILLPWKKKTFWNFGKKCLSGCFWIFVSASKMIRFLLINLIVQESLWYCHKSNLCASVIVCRWDGINNYNIKLLLDFNWLKSAFFSWKWQYLIFLVLAGVKIFSNMSYLMEFEAAVCDTGRSNGNWEVEKF